jgi:uncharacterized membrane protein YozB (DUF420 family)
LGEEWPKQATDAVVKVVDTVRDKTTGPAVNAAHAAKYGVVLAIMGTVLSVIVIIGLIRLLEAIFQTIGYHWGIPALEEPIWLVYLVLGVAFSAIGLGFFRLANKPARHD